MSQPVFPPATNCPINKKRTLGFCKLLFETPSGFAIFSFNMRYLHKDIEDTWLYFVGDYWHYSFLAMHVFRRFEDKSDAINLTTRQVGGRMIGLLCKYCLPGELIIVGRPEYKSIIEEKLRRACVCNDIVREIMWGMQNLMPLLIPQEQSEFTKADRLPICKGLDMLLSQHGINNVKPEWINEDILQMAVKVYHADLREKEHSNFLRRSLGLDKHLKAISGFDAKDWDLVKLATALKTMVDPVGIPRLTLGEAFEMFLPEEVKLIHRDAPKYEDLLDRDTILKIYDDIVAVRDYVDKVLLKLRHLLKKAEAALETEDVLEQVDLAVDLVLVPNQSSIAEEQQRHITSGADGTLPSQMTNEPGTSVEGTNQENEAEKASLGDQRNTILVSVNVPLIEEVVATSKDTPAVGTTQDVAQHANTRAQEIDAEQTINALVKTRGMDTNNGGGGEQADEDITGGGGVQADKDITGGGGVQADEDITSGGEQAEVTDLSKSVKRTSAGKIPGEGGKQAEVTDLSKSVETTSAEKIPGEGGKQAEPSRTGLHAEQSKDKKTSAKVASPTKQVSVEGTVQNNDDGRKWRDTSLLSLLSIESPEQTQTRRSESMTLDNMSKSHAQDFRGRESKAVTSWSGPLAQRSSDSLPVYQPRSIHHLPDLLASGSRPPLAAGSKKTSTKDAASSVKAGSKDKKTSTKDALSSVKAVPPETSSADPEAALPDPEAVPSQGFHFVKKTFGLIRKQP